MREVPEETGPADTLISSPGLPELQGSKSLWFGPSRQMLLYYICPSRLLHTADGLTHLVYKHSGGFQSDLEAAGCNEGPVQPRPGVGV